MKGLKFNHICNDFEVEDVYGYARSKRNTGDREFGASFTLEYSTDYNDIMLYCNPDYDESELIGIRYCPWCGDKIEFEVVEKK